MDTRDDECKRHKAATRLATNNVSTRRVVHLHGWSMYVVSRPTRERFELCHRYHDADVDYALVAGVGTGAALRTTSPAHIRSAAALLTSSTLCCDPVVGTAGTTFEVVAEAAAL